MMGAGTKRTRLVESEAEGVRDAVEQLERLRLQMPDEERRLAGHVGIEAQRLLYGYRAAEDSSIVAAAVIVANVVR